jgi:hypothetical protein
MEILALRAYARGYRGCLVDDREYVFFQYTRNQRVRRLKAYPRTDFTDHDHFAALMMKFMSPGAFMRPAVPISELTLAELDRVNTLLKQRIESE